MKSERFNNYAYASSILRNTKNVTLADVNLQNTFILYSKLRFA
jgi:hypothetical protein